MKRLQFLQKSWKRRKDCKKDGRLCFTWLSNRKKYDPKKERDPRKPLCFAGFRFAEVLLNRRNSLEPVGFGGFRALCDFRVRGPSAMLRGERGAGY